MMKKLLFIIIPAMFLLSGCKPTEKGYKSAYDAALGKREAAMADMGMDLPKGAIQQVDGPQLRDVDGVKVYVLNQRIKPADTVMEMPGSYNVAIGTYKMITNCRAQSEDLIAQGYHAFPAQDTKGMFFTIAGSFKTLQEAVTFYQEYQKGKNRVYVGLPNAPVIIYSPVR